MLLERLLLLGVDELARSVAVCLAIELMDVRLRHFLRMRHVGCALCCSKITLRLLPVAA